MYKLYARPGWGSVLAEAQLAWYGLDFELEELDDLFASAAAREKLAPLNPLAQVPTLVPPDGQIMTESAAITLHLADVTGSTDLVPAVAEAAEIPALAGIPGRECLPDLHLYGRPGPVRLGRSCSTALRR